MHMADALVSPAVGGAMWAATAVTTVYCAKKVREEDDPAKIPLMGVAGAFVFAGQMLNFTIPATGSSGHIGGGLLLAMLLGPHAAFLVMASVLAVQALFFADGGLLALGCNIFNLGFWPAFVAFPLIYRRIVGNTPTAGRVVAGSLFATVVGLQLGALGVVLQTTASGVSELPFTTFLALMQPIHLAIGVVEGLITAGVALFVLRAQPELLARTASGSGLVGLRLKQILVGLAAGAIIAGAGISWFASTQADGLEWSLERITGSAEVEADGAVHEFLAGVQESTSFLPDYGFPANEGVAEEPAGEPAWPAVDAGTSTSGLVGASTVLALATAIGFFLKARNARSQRQVNTSS